MTIDELKRVPIVSILEHLGHTPVSRLRGGRQWMYRSPLRADSNASFSVSLDKNLWYDFGTSQGGNVIDLAILLNGNCSVRAALLWLEDQNRAIGTESPIQFTGTRDGTWMGKDPVMQSIRMEPLHHPALMDYLRSRGIPKEIGQHYCKEAHYAIRGKEHFGIGFPNILGGVEIRNPFFKGSHGPKAPSIVPVGKERHTEACCVFEGFMDFLSYQALERTNDAAIIQPFPCDCIVLNSTALVKKAVPFIDVYSKAYCYLDNDNAGQGALKRLNEFMPGKVKSNSGRYRCYNDLNDYLQRRPDHVRSE